MKLKRCLPESYTEVARLGQVHGLKGEINLFCDDYDPLPFGKGDFLFARIDELFVPFRIESLRSRSGAYLIAFTSFDTAEKASRLKNLTLWGDADIYGDDSADSSDDDDALYAADLVGFEAFDSATRMPVGRIVDYDDSTMNMLLIVERPDGSECYIPFVEAYIQEIEPDSRHIHLNLPPGFDELA